MIASHPRCYEKHKEIIDPVHFLPLLEQRTGAFEHSTAMRKLRSELPVIFDELLSRLRLDEGLGVREFVRVLRLLETCARSQLETAVTGALKLGAVNRDVIELILRTQTQPEWLSEPLTLDTLPSQLGLFAQNTPAPDLGIYDGLLNSLTLTTTLTAPTAPTAPSLETQTHV